MPRPRVMYIENKSAQPQGQKGVVGPARIGRVTFSKTGKSLYYRGKTFQSLKGNGFKANYYDVDSGEQYWISGPKKNGADGLLSNECPVFLSNTRRARNPRSPLSSPVIRKLYFGHKRLILATFGLSLILRTAARNLSAIVTLYVD